MEAICFVCGKKIGDKDKGWQERDADIFYCMDCGLEVIGRRFSEKYKRPLKEVNSFNDRLKKRVTEAREKNIGWRIDYFVVSDRLLPAVKDSRILTDVMGSDHCPVCLEIEI